MRVEPPDLDPDDAFIARLAHVARHSPRSASRRAHRSVRGDCWWPPAVSPWSRPAVRTPESSDLSDLWDRSARWVGTTQLRTTRSHPLARTRGPSRCRPPQGPRGLQASRRGSHRRTRPGSRPVARPRTRPVARPVARPATRAQTPPEAPPDEEAPPHQEAAPHQATASDQAAAPQQAAAPHQAAEADETSEADRPAHGQARRQAHRQADRQARRQADRPQTRAVRIVTGGVAWLVTTT